MSDNVTVTISLPRAVVDEIDARAKRRKKSRSQYLRDALERACSVPPKPLDVKE
jgi:metal-responsive CopG/Arc/MetJ family transcriptional regulator